MTRFTPFALEEFMSRYEQQVDVNLTESGVHPLTLGELLDLAGTTADDLRSIAINYPHVEGTGNAIAICERQLSNSDPATRSTFYGGVGERIGL